MSETPKCSAFILITIGEDEAEDRVVISGPVSVRMLDLLDDATQRVVKRITEGRRKMGFVFPEPGASPDFGARSLLSEVD